MHTSVHLTLATVGRVPVAGSESQRRAILHVLGALFRGLLLLFAIADDHVHVVFRAAPEDARRLAGALARELEALTTLALQPPHLEPVKDRSHLLSLVRYVLQQPAHHGLMAHAALTSGSCFPELVGARCVPGLALVLFEQLPRESAEAFAVHVGLPKARLEPATPAEIRRLGAFRLVAAAAFATGSGPDPDGRHPAANRARVAAAKLAVDAGIDEAELAAALGVRASSARRLTVREVDRATLGAVRLRLALEEEVRRVSERVAILTMMEAVRRREVVPRAAIEATM